MINASRPAAFLAAAVVLAACTSGGSPAPSPSAGSPSATSGTAAATVTFEVANSDREAAERTIRTLRTRLDLLGLQPGEARVDGSMARFDVARLPEREQLVELAHTGRLQFRPVVEVLGPKEGTPAGDCGSPSFRVTLGGLASGPAVVSQRVEACDASGDARYVLGPAEAGNADVKRAEAKPGATSAGTATWVLSLEMADPAKWAGLTERHVGRQLAIVFDGQVESAPSIQTRIDDGVAEISGSFTESRARVVAAMLGSGPLETHVVLRS